MVNWETSITSIYIRNHDSSYTICEINTKTGEIIEKLRTSMSNTDKFWRGFYKNIDVGMIGVFASSIGPILFINQIYYPLIKGDYNIVWTKKGENLDRREFIFYYLEKEIYREEYDEVKCLYTNPYEEDEEFRDFFLWMHGNMNNDNFYRFYKYSED